MEKVIIHTCKQTHIHRVSEKSLYNSARKVLLYCAGCGKSLHKTLQVAYVTCHTPRRSLLTGAQGCFAHHSHHYCVLHNCLLIKKFESAKLLLLCVII